jgi:hypothetical protein
MKTRILLKVGLMSTLLSFLFTACDDQIRISANDNTSRPTIPDRNGDNKGNDEISGNLSAGSDANPTNKLYDGVWDNSERLQPKASGHHTH